MKLDGRILYLTEDSNSSLLSWGDDLRLSDADMHYGVNTDAMIADAPARWATPRDPGSVLLGELQGDRGQG